MKISAIKYVRSLFWCKNHKHKPHDWVSHMRRNHKGAENHIFQITVEENGREQYFYAIIAKTLKGRIYAEIRENLPDYKDWTEDVKMEVEAWKTLTRMRTAVLLIGTIYNKLGILPQWEHDFGLLTFAKPLFFTWESSTAKRIAGNIDIYWPHRAFHMEIRFPDHLLIKLPKHKNISHEIEVIDDVAYVIIKLFNKSGRHTWSIYWKPKWLVAVNERNYLTYIHDEKMIKYPTRYPEFSISDSKTRIRILNNKLRVSLEEEVSNEDTKME